MGEEKEKVSEENRRRGEQGRTGSDGVGCCRWQVFLHPSARTADLDMKGNFLIRLRGAG